MADTGKQSKDWRQLLAGQSRRGTAALTLRPGSLLNWSSGYLALTSDEGNGGFDEAGMPPAENVFPDASLVAFCWSEADDSDSAP